MEVFFFFNPLHDFKVFRFSRIRRSYLSSSLKNYSRTFPYSKVIHAHGRSLNISYCSFRHVPPPNKEFKALASRRRSPGESQHLSRCRGGGTCAWQMCCSNNRSVSICTRLPRGWTCKLILPYISVQISVSWTRNPPRPGCSPHWPQLMC